MTADSFLSTAAEVAIGLAGFAGIIAAVRQRGLSSWPLRHRVLIRTLFGACAAAVTFALLPSLLVEARIPTDLVWRVGSGMLAGLFVLAAAFRIRQYRRQGGEAPLPRGLLVWVGCISILQLVNVGLATTWIYLLGVYTLLINGFSVFMTLLLEDAGHGDRSD